MRKGNKKAAIGRLPSSRTVGVMKSRKGKGVSYNLRDREDSNMAICTESLHQIYKTEDGLMTCPDCRKSLYSKRKKRGAKQDTISTAVIVNKKRRVI